MFTDDGSCVLANFHGKNPNLCTYDPIHYTNQFNLTWGIKFILDNHGLVPENICEPFELDGGGTFWVPCKGSWYRLGRGEAWDKHDVTGVRMVPCLTESTGAVHQKYLELF